MKIIKYVFLVLFAVANITSSKSQSVSQSVISPGGNTFSNNDYIVSFTIGEPVIKTFKNNNIILTQGFQQSFSVVSATFNFNTNENIIVFPIPFKDHINIKLNKNIKPGDGLNYKIYNINGHLVKKNNIYSIKTTLNTSDLSQGLFLLKVFQNEKSINTTKLIKN